MGFVCFPKSKRPGKEAKPRESKEPSPFTPPRIVCNWVSFFFFIIHSFVDSVKIVSCIIEETFAPRHEFFGTLSIFFFRYSFFFEPACSTDQGSSLCASSDSSMDIIDAHCHLQVCMSVWFRPQGQNICEERA